MLKIVLLKIIAVHAYVIMIVFNFLANALPLGGRSTGEISSQYNNLFTPSGLTFSIWGLIYVSLFFLLMIYLFKPLQSFKKRHENILTAFIISGFLNTLWLITWHYDFIISSSLVMIFLLFTLIYGYRNVDKTSHVEAMSFSLYMAWISVALIANLIITGVYLGGEPFSIFAEVIVHVLLIIGALLVLFIVGFFKDSIFPLVFSWAYLGIFIRHMLGEELSGNYLSLMFLSGFLSVVFLFIGMHYFNQNKGYLRDNA